MRTGCLRESPHLGLLRGGGRCVLTKVHRCVWGGEPGAPAEQRSGEKQLPEASGRS